MTFKEELEQILKGYHDRLLMTETAYDIKQRNVALTSIINLVDKEAKPTTEQIKHAAELSILDQEIMSLKAEIIRLKKEQRAIIRKAGDE